MINGEESMNAKLSLILRGKMKKMDERSDDEEKI
jgi:hypothetical protein